MHVDLVGLVHELDVRETEAHGGSLLDEEACELGHSQGKTV